EQAGILHTKAREGDTLAIGAVVCTIEASGAPDENAAPSNNDTKETAQAAPAAVGAKTYASGTPSPAAAKILAEKGVDTKSVSGTGVAGRITKEDALLAEKISENPQVSKGSQQSEAGSQKPEVVMPKAESFAPGARADRREKMSSLRKTVARRLVTVKNETAMLTTFNEVDMSPIMELRSK